MTKAEKDGFKAQILDEIIKVSKKARNSAGFNAKEFERLLSVRIKELRGVRKKVARPLIADFT